MSSRQPPPRSYHHGDLRSALVQAADEILAAEGLAAFSLRAAARRVGVSAAAPTHHFGHAAGLLSEVAVLGFQALGQELAVSHALPPRQRLKAQGLGYLRFALAHPGRFQLMFRKELVDDRHEGLHAAGAQALAQLEDTIRALHGLSPGQPLDPQARAELFAAWTMVHGFAHLALDGKLAHLQPGEAPEHLLAQMLDGQWPEEG